MQPDSHFTVGSVRRRAKEVAIAWARRERQLVARDLVFYDLEKQVHRCAVCQADDGPVIPNAEGDEQRRDTAERIVDGDLGSARG